MHLSKNSVKHRSLGLWTAILSVASFVTAGGALSGCIFVGDDDHDSDHHEWETDPPPSLPDPMLVSIDADQIVEAEPGEGVGLFVEYTSGGDWLLWTTCDTNYSNVACKFDVFASVDLSSELISIEGVDMEGFDEVEVLENEEAHMHAETASDTDGIRIVTTPGAILRVEVILDGVANERFVYWVSDGILHEGAPSNPVDFQPNSP